METKHTVLLYEWLGVRMIRICTVHLFFTVNYFTLTTLIGFMYCTSEQLICSLPTHIGVAKSTLELLFNWFLPESAGGSTLLPRIRTTPS